MQKINNFNNILKSLNIKAICVDYNEKSNYFYYDLTLNTSAKVKDIQKHVDEISLILKTPSKPSIKILYEKGLVRLEFATFKNKELKLFDYFTNDKVPNGSINCLLGQTVAGDRVWMDLSQNPHMIVSGTTGSGKSTLLHNIIANCINYNNVDLHLVDPKQVEFVKYLNVFGNIKVYNNYSQTLSLLKDLICIMEDRYNKICQGTEINSFTSIVVVIDEFANLIMQDKDNEFYKSLCLLAQKCRAAKIHIILSTQRPSTDIINGTIKANFPARISCKVASHTDSKVVLDSSGAENLSGKGDALLKDNLRNLERFQIAYTDAEEICRAFKGLS
jgi:S-DNA-T family DNA segregation ATPase FtsK/SpoIIIE